VSSIERRNPTESQPIEITHLLFQSGSQRAEPESVRRLFVVAVGWILLAMVPSFAVGFFRGFAIGFVSGLTKGASHLQIPPMLNQLLTVGEAYCLALVLLYAASVRGRIVGGGERRIGLGAAPIAKLPIVIGLSVALVFYAALIDFAIYSYRPDIFFQSSSVSPWLTLLGSLLVVVLAPLAEELFFRGWLWTGLRKHWSARPTGLVTAAIWLVLHLERGVGYVVLLLFPAVMLTIARQVGKSVRSTVAMHAIYNLAVDIPLIVLVLKLFQS
jgi:membrane protease YdiL (CAAX protease family)